MALSPSLTHLARKQQIESRLQAAFYPDTLSVIDESHHHIGHEGAKGGGGHYRLVIISAEFFGKSELQRQRLVYKALGELMRSKIHALSIKTLSPDETRKK